MRSDTDQARKSPGPYEDPDAYEVYSAVLSRNGGGRIRSLSSFFRTFRQRNGPSVRLRALFKGTPSSPDDSTVFSSLSNRRTGTVAAAIPFCFPKALPNCQLLRVGGSFSSSRAEHNRDGWEGFRQTFPDSAGYVILSAVGFNSEKTIALVYVEYRCGGLCGSSRYYILEKRDGRWVRSTPKGLKSEDDRKLLIEFSGKINLQSLGEQPAGWHSAGV